MVRPFGLALAGLLTLPFLASAATTLTLQQAEQFALKNNLELRATVLQLEARSARLSGSRGIYDPTLTSTLNTGRSRQAIDDGNLSTQDDRSIDGSVGLAQRFSTGAVLSATLGDDRTRTNSVRSINPAYRGDLTLTLSQPLLRDFGSLATEQNILRAEKEQDLALQDRELTAAVLIREVRTSWYEVLRLQQNLELRQASIDLARQLERENAARVEAGVLPEVELLSARVGLQLRLVQQQEAHRQLYNERDRLSLLMQADFPDPLAATLPQPEAPALNTTAGLDLARQQRPELRRLQVAVEQADLEVRIAQNQQKPDLSLVASYGHRSLEDDLGESLGNLADTDYNSWTLGLSLSYPLGNRQRRNDTRAAEFTLGQNRLLLRQGEEEVRREIDSAARLLETRLEQLKAVQLESRLADERVRILLERQKVGLATVTDVLDGEEDLTDARTREFQSMADVQIAHTQYLFATGALLAEARQALAKVSTPTSSTGQTR